MKIGITTDWYTPAVNGVVTSVKNLQRELERRGHEVRILTLSQSLHSWSRDGVTAIGSVNAGRIASRRPPPHRHGGPLGTGADGLAAGRDPLPM